MKKSIFILMVLFGFVENAYAHLPEGSLEIITYGVSLIIIVMFVILIRGISQIIVSKKRKIK